MATRLSEIKLSEVSLVDTPANPGAHVVLFKRGEPIEKVIVTKCSECGGNVEKKEKQMAIEFTKEQLTPEAVKFLEKMEKDIATASEAEINVLKAKNVELEKKLADATKPPEPEDIWKGVSPEVRKRLEDSEARALKAEEIAKNERDSRELQEFTKRAETEFSSLPGTAIEKGKVLKAVHQKLAKEEAAEVEKLLKSAEEIAKSGKLFGEMGASGGNVNLSDSAEGRLIAKAQDMVSKGVVKSEAEGMEKIAREDPALYQEYQKEVRRRTN